MPLKKIKSKLNLSQIIIASLTTALLSFIVGIAIFYTTSKEPELNYELLPISSFTSDNMGIKIFNIRIENSGDKEAEDVVVNFLFPEKTKFLDHSIKLSSSAIDYKYIKVDSSTIKYLFPILNPFENCIFSFLSSL
jgi:hypothetical protein